MQTITEYMAGGHKVCDDEFAIAEKASYTREWSVAKSAFNTFRDDMAHHFRIEEEVLFPELVSAGGPAGPVHIMCMEHTQINELLDQMAAALANEDTQEYQGLSETLLMVMQQHNLKEEQILYPIADRVLSAERESVLNRMQQA
ncbi:MAG: hemerythrin domain-containing protein [Gallionella sp.]